MTYQVMTTSRQPQIIIDQAALTQIQQDLAKRIADLERLRAAIETLAQVNEPERFAAAAMALCNQLATRWQAERASVGFLKGRYVRLAALSHTEKFTRQMRLVQDIEASMEECLDQDVEVLYPPVAQATYVSRATEALALRHGPTAVCNLPLRRGGEVVAVVSIERKADRPFALEEVETLRLTCDLATARLANLHDQDRWVGARLAAATRKGLAEFLGPTHTWYKVIALVVCAVLVFAVVAKGHDEVSAPCTFQAIEKQVIPAPFDGHIQTVNVSLGDPVVSVATARQMRALSAALYPLPSPIPEYLQNPTILATLDTSELKNKLAEAHAERLANLKQAEIARRDGKIAEAQADEEQARKSQASEDLYAEQIRQAVLTSDLDGLVFTGDLKQKIGAPVKTGDVLFEVGQLQALRAELAVSEDEVSRLKVGDEGELATASYPSEKAHFNVYMITPIANPEKQADKTGNFFMVRVALDAKSIRPWMHPGMEGIAKVQVGQEKVRYGWLWIRKPANWVRMKLWQYSPF